MFGLPLRCQNPFNLTLADIQGFGAVLTGFASRARLNKLREGRRGTSEVTLENLRTKPVSLGKTCVQ
ncbi:unnamed protein product [Arabis nemorensis]|uniref:Uncharacterized protein n=1 Tax=Arabis nemorensis TaxID=586526 RepID=A0A565C0W9_9BRAS|nr:unnamed protein product [Arabis nemorensis]